LGGQEVDETTPGAGLREAGGEDELEGPLYGEEGFEGLPESNGGSCGTGASLRPLLTMPTSCGRSLTATLRVDSWEEAHGFEVGEGPRTKSASLPEMTGCESLGLKSSLSVSPEKKTASVPSGLGVGVDVAQEGLENPSGLAAADVRDGTLVFPAGVTLNPSAANGLEACSEAQAGFTGFAELDSSGEPGVQTPQFEERVTNPATGHAEASLCPEASKVANVRIKTPLLETEVEGGVYLAAPQNFMNGIQENPFSSLTAVYLIAEDHQAGVIVKLPGNLKRDPVTGQLTATVEETPQLPFSELKLEFFGGERASFATPATCGVYTALASLTPWSATPVSNGSSSFEIGPTGPGGATCGNPLPLNAAVNAQMASVNAGGFGALSTSVSREDGQEALRGVSLSFPPGLTAVLKGVPLCVEAEANAGTCGSESQIGEAVVTAGLGQDPVTVTGGKVFLTGPYDGAPYGLSIENVAAAGPFVLEEGRPVVVRAKIEVNPVSSAVTVSTTGEIPHILDGVPLEIKHIYVNVNRPSFAINPTSCEPMKITGAVTGLEGASSLVSDPFQVANCSSLKFKPTVTITTGAHSSKKDGASLNIKVAYPTGALGSQAWFKEAKLVIPKQLPAELKTIQQACLAATFEANPANCPVHSKIGEAVVHTQLLAEPLKGPIYFVSYGAAKFPDAVILLSGDNINVRLTSETYIHNGITSVTLPEIPDDPVESSEFNLPAGEYAEFGTNLGLGKYDFCGQKLTVPTELKAQNGLEIRQETPVTITGCPTSISIQSKTLHKHTLTITIYIPAAGKLTATGKGLTTQTKTTTTQTLLTLNLTPKHHGKLKTTIKLTYTPTHGKKQTTTLHTTYKH
jgi:hypothetical protein